jgi:DNA-directed RNA polymerase specialized sigma54-like protein
MSIHLKVSLNLNFFHSGLESLDGDAMSSVSVKDIIRKAVAAEDSRKPLTDQQLMMILEAKV